MGLIQRFLGRGWVDPVETPAAPAKPAPAIQGEGVDVLQFDGKDIRTVWIDGAQWWVAADVCAAIEIANVGQAVQGLDEDEKGSICLTDGTSPRGGNPNVLIVNEPGLYHLLAKSTKPKAKEFWRWVRHDVLPSIRQTGSYSVDQPKEDQTPIRGWIRKRARHSGFGVAWQKKRQKVADGNRAADSQTFAIGGDAVACSKRYNALYHGLFGMVSRQLKSALGCRQKDSPLDRTGDFALACYDAANSAMLLQMKAGLVSPENLAAAATEAGKIQREAARQMLPGHDFGVTEDQKGRKILEAMRQLPN